jgi:hypothetical protein
MQLAADSPVNPAKIYHSLPTLQRQFLKLWHIYKHKKKRENKAKTALSFSKKSLGNFE